MTTDEARYGLVWWGGAERWHFPVNEPSRRGDLVECGHRVPVVGAVSWSADSGARVKLMEICAGCISARSRRFKGIAGHIAPAA